MTRKTLGGRWEIPLADTEIDEREIDAVARVLRSGWLTAGPETAAFEREFAEKLGVAHAVAVSNCTAALHLAHLALEIGPGDEVVCPVLTFVATANATRYTGADVVACDVVGAHDLTLSPAALERSITPRTKAVSVMHYGGFACRMDAVMEIAARNGLRVIEDCAHAPGARHAAADGATPSLGTIGDVGCFSFFGNKNMTTGEGGMLTTGDAELARRLRLLRSHGMTAASYDKFSGHAHGYDVVALGHNYRLDDVRSAIGRVQLAKLDEIHRRRRRVFSWYLEELKDVDGVQVPFADRDLELATPHILSIVTERDGDLLRRKLTDAGIQTSKHYELLTRFATYRQDPGSTPIAAGLDLLTLPLGPRLTREQVRRIAAVLREG